MLLLFAMYFLMCFYLYSAADEEASRRRANKEAVAVVAVVVVITLAAVSVPHEVFAGSFSTADMTIPQIAVFYGGAGCYLTYVLGLAARWTSTYARMSCRPHATGLWMAAIGLGAMAVACAIRAVIVAVRWFEIDVPQRLMAAVAFLLVASILLFTAGITYSGVRARIASSKLWLQHRRDHRRLAALWELLAEAFPDNVLPPASSSTHDRRRARGVHRRYHRRIVEIRDGLVAISPYLLVDDTGITAPDVDSDELAAQLRRASARIKEGAPVPRRAVPLAMTLGSDRAADVKQLIAVSDALVTDRATPLTIKEAPC
ncbi:hypothetical protein LXH09_35495 [Streptomyces sp. CS7]|nr:hypothetical protein [Streptomyces sp. CS-7]